MITSPASILIISIVILGVVSASSNWNEDGIDWFSGDWESAVTKAGDEGKPLMLIIHRTWCGACKSLEQKFSESKEIEALSKRMVVVNTADESQGRDSPIFKNYSEAGFLTQFLTG
jgi:protein-disulfide reductase (glutathione)